MTNKTPCIYFYLPEDYWQINDDVLGVLNRYLNGDMAFSDLWEWHVKTHPSLKSDGLFAWIIQPYLFMKKRGLLCELTPKIPSQGIVIMSRKFVKDDLKPGSDRVFVIAKSDSKVLKYAQLHVVENIHEDLVQRPSSLWKSCFIPHFPQPGLMPRSYEYGDRFQNIAYFGLDRNLAPELCTPQWVDRLTSLGFNWRIVERDSWHDYRNIDAIVAVRSFDKFTYTVKPASKLYNAWHAGVPAILGAESSFQSERRSNLDYLEVKSADQIIDALILLKDDKDLRQKIIENGKKRSQNIQQHQVADYWERFFKQDVYPYYHNWISSSKFKQGLFILARNYEVKLKKPISSKFLRFRGQIKQSLVSLFPFLNYSK